MQQILKKSKGVQLKIAPTLAIHLPNSLKCVQTHLGVTFVTKCGMTVPKKGNLKSTLET